MSAAGSTIFLIAFSVLIAGVLGYASARSGRWLRIGLGVVLGIIGFVLGGLVTSSADPIYLAVTFGIVAWLFGGFIARRRLA